MKTLIYTLSFLMVTFFAVPEINAAAPAAEGTTEIYGNGINQSGAKRFKTHKGNKRRKNTCLRKSGCKPKLRNQAKSKCGGFM